MPTHRHQITSTILLIALFVAFSLDAFADPNSGLSIGSHCKRILFKLSQNLRHPIAQWASREIAKSAGLQSPQSIEITFVPQTHWFITAERNKAEQLETFESQWKIAQLIRRLKPDFVFNEGTFLHLQPQDRKVLTDVLISADHPGAGTVIAELAPQFLRAFKGKVPTNSTEFDYDQKLIFSKLGAVNSLWLSGELDQIFPADDLELNTAGIEGWVNRALNFASSWKQGIVRPQHWPKLFSELSSVAEEKKWNSRLREIAALASVASHTRSDHSLTMPAKAFLVFGAAHNFEAYSTVQIRIERVEP